MLLPGALAQDDDASKSPSAVSYEQEVKPIVERKCSGCHINGGHSGGLQLDSFDSMMRGVDDGSVVELGSLEMSMVSKAIHYGDEDLQMTPPTRGQLDAADIAAIDKWIKENSGGGTTATSTASTPAVTALSATQAVGSAPVRVRREPRRWLRR
jgi:mono/diheme cytochrome c family protein